MLPVLLFSLTLFAAVLISDLAERSIISTAVLFLLVGFLSGEGVAHLVRIDAGAPVVSEIVTLALFMTLFTDGMRVRVPELRRSWGLPGRALLLGLPLSVLGTALVARLRAEILTKVGGRLPRSGAAAVTPFQASPGPGGWSGRPWPASLGAPTSRAAFPTPPPRWFAGSSLPRPSRPARPCRTWGSRRPRRGTSPPTSILCAKSGFACRGRQRRQFGDGHGMRTGLSPFRPRLA
jgi:hypothetical protein